MNGVGKRPPIDEIKMITMNTIAQHAIGTPALIGQANHAGLTTINRGAKMA